MVEYSAGRVQGPLAPFAAGFVVELVARGYQPRSVRGQLELMAHLSGWLAEQGLEPAGLTENIAERFLAVRRERDVNLRSWRAFGPLVVYLRGLGVVPEPVVLIDTPVARLLADYRDYLLRERGLTAGSAAHWERVARLFLAERSEPLEDALRELTTSEVTGFVVARCAPGRCSGSTAKILTGGLRSLLRYLHVAGFTAIPLAQAVPRAAGWRLSSLPRALEAAQVARLLESCDRATVIGRRDLAILSLLARLGLRCCEVSGLCLDDIDWRAGEVTIRGKGSATERLPLPHDVGEALVDYLRDGTLHVCGVPRGVRGREGAAAAVVTHYGHACRRPVRASGWAWSLSVRTDFVTRSPATCYVLALRWRRSRHSATRERDDYCHIREGRSGCAQVARAAVAVCWRCSMTSLRDMAEDYLRMRRALGYKLEIQGLLLGGFVSYLEEIDAVTVTIENAVAWATLTGRRGPVLLGRATVSGAPVRPSSTDDRPGLRGTARTASALPVTQERSRTSNEPAGDHRADGTLPDSCSRRCWPRTTGR